MRISDWSSDVCSSDLRLYRLRACRAARQQGEDRNAGAQDELSANHANSPGPARDSLRWSGLAADEPCRARQGREWLAGTLRINLDSRRGPEAAHFVRISLPLLVQRQHGRAHVRTPVT